MAWLIQLWLYLQPCRIPRLHCNQALRCRQTWRSCCRLQLLVACRLLGYHPTSIHSGKDCRSCRSKFLSRQMPLSFRQQRLRGLQGFHLRSCHLGYLSIMPWQYPKGQRSQGQLGSLHRFEGRFEHRRHCCIRLWSCIERLKSSLQIGFLDLGCRRSLLCSSSYCYCCLGSLHRHPKLSNLRYCCQALKRSFEQLLEQLVPLLEQ